MSIDAVDTATRLTASATLGGNPGFSANWIPSTFAVGV